MKPLEHDTAIKRGTTTGNSLFRFGNTLLDEKKKKEQEEGARGSEGEEDREMERWKGNGRGVLRRRSEPD